MTEPAESNPPQHLQNVERLQRLAGQGVLADDAVIGALAARVALDHATRVNALLSTAGRVLTIGVHTVELLGRDQNELLGRRIWDCPVWGTPETWARVKEVVLKAASGERSVGEAELAIADEPLPIPIELSASPVFDAAGDVAFIVVEGRDQRPQRRAEDELRRQTHSLTESEARFRAIAENSSDLICLHEMDGTYTYVSPAMRDLLGYEPDELIGTHPRDHVHPEDRARFAIAFEHDPYRPRAADASYRVRQRGGDYIWFDTVVVPITNDDGVATELQSSSRDFTDRKKSEEDLIRRAFHDDLTGLPNRALLLDRVTQSLAVSTRTGRGLAVMVLDLDGFRELNEIYSHQVGDAVLVAIAERLRPLVRPTDTLARFAGDEFIMLCIDTDGASGASIVARRIIQALEQPVEVADKSFDLSCSIGIATSTAGGTMEAEQLLGDAERAMSEAKREGRGKYVIFDPAEREAIRAKQELTAALADAIDNGELRLHYQPELDLATGRLVGFEALVRWQRPTGELVPPADFIPLAEETGLIVPLGSWVINEACRQARAWALDVASGDGGVRIWVNVSARQLDEPALVATVREALTSAQLPADRLCIEITESALMRDAEAAAAQLEELRRLGISLGIDDFGTGYSSLAYLSRFALDVLKIDRSFVSRLGQDRESTTIVAAIIDLAHALGMKTIAEGVETEEQLAELRRLNCDQAVGYLFSRPEAPQKFDELMQV